MASLQSDPFDRPTDRPATWAGWAGWASVEQRLSIRTYALPPPPSPPSSSQHQRIPRFPRAPPPPAELPDGRFKLFHKLQSHPALQTPEGRKKVFDRSLNAVSLFLGTFCVIFLIRWELDREHREESQVYTAHKFDTKFSLPTKSDPSNVRVDTWKLIGLAEAERVLKADEKIVTLDRPGNPVVRSDTSSLKANEFIEDRSAQAILKGADGDLCFFAVFDGHSGFQTSHLLSQTLIPTTSLSVQSTLSRSPSPFSSDSELRTTTDQPSPSSFSTLGLSRLRDIFSSSSKQSRELEGASMDEIKESIKHAWQTLDKSIVWDPVDLLSSLPSNPDLSLISYPTILPALSGSCALLSVIDTARKDIYIALAGDCRAVAGYWVPNPASTQLNPDGQTDQTSQAPAGRWRVEVLTEDQTGRNPKACRELERIQGEHPQGERDSVIMRGRVLGGLEPSRAFGDARYKWSKEIQPELIDSLVPAGSKRPRPAPSLSKTPPYVTATPEVIHLKSDGSDREGELRFLVLGTDGLYDRLSNEAIVGLVGAFIDQPDLHGEIPRADILSTVDSLSTGFDGKNAKVQAKKAESTEGTFMFGKDLNAATLLIRNSLAGGDDRKMRELLSVGPPLVPFTIDISQEDKQKRKHQASSQPSITVDRSPFQPSSLLHHLFLESFPLSLSSFFPFIRFTHSPVMPSKQGSSRGKPSFWQSVTHAPSKSYSQAAPIHPSKLPRGSRRSEEPYPPTMGMGESGRYRYMDREDRYRYRGDSDDDDEDHGDGGNHYGRYQRRSASSGGDRTRPREWSAQDEVEAEDDDKDSSDGYREEEGRNTTRWIDPRLRKAGRSSAAYGGSDGGYRTTQSSDWFDHQSFKEEYMSTGGRRKTRSSSMVDDRPNGWKERRERERDRYEDEDELSDPSFYRAEASSRRRRQREREGRGREPSPGASDLSDDSYRQKLSRSYLPSTTTKREAIQRAGIVPSLVQTDQKLMSSSANFQEISPSRSIDSVGQSDSESDAFYTPVSSPRLTSVLTDPSFLSTQPLGVQLRSNGVADDVVIDSNHLSPPRETSRPNHQPGSDTFTPFLTLQPPTPTAFSTGPLASPSSSASTPTGSGLTYFGTDGLTQTDITRRTEVPPPLIREVIPPPLIHPIRRETYESAYGGISSESNSPRAVSPANEDVDQVYGRQPAMNMLAGTGASASTGDSRTDEAYIGAMLSPVGEEEEDTPYFSTARLMAGDQSGVIGTQSQLVHRNLRNTGNGSPSRASSALSLASSVSRYSQNSYRPDVDVPPPVILSSTLEALTISNSVVNDRSGSGGSGNSSPMELSQSRYYHRNRRGSESSVGISSRDDSEWTPPSLYPSAFPPAPSPISGSPLGHSSNPSSVHPSPITIGGPSFRSPSPSPSSATSAGRQQFFLPRPTSTLMNTFEMTGSYPSAVSSPVPLYPSAPSSVISDGGGAAWSRARSIYGATKKASSAIDDRSEADVRSLNSFAGDRSGEVRAYTTAQRRASTSEVGFHQMDKKGSRAMSDAGLESISRYRQPQVMSGSIYGDSGSSLSGGAGYSTLTLPSGAYRPSKSPSRYVSKVAYDTLGIPQTTMATITITSTARPAPSPTSTSSPSSLLHRSSSLSLSSPSSTASAASLLVHTPVISASFTSHIPPPKKLSSTSLLVRVWAVALDAYDAFAARDASKGFIPGRSFVGKVVEWGDGVNEFSKGDWVFGLLSVKRSGALSEFIEIERRYLAKAPSVGALASELDSGLSLEDIASLPLLGVSAHRAVGGINKGSRALVLLGESPTASENTVPAIADWSVGILAAQELVSRGVVVIIQVSADLGESWVRSLVPNVREGHVRTGEPVEVVHEEHEGSFDFILDCGGGRRTYDASRRIMITGGRFTSLKGDLNEPLSSEGAPTKNSMRSLRRTFVKKDKKHIDYNVISPSGSGPMVDHMGEDIRDVLEWIAGTRIYRPPRVEKAVPFEQGAEPFGVIRREKGKGLSRYRCEEEVWAVRLVS
ncbi:Protein phosphatase 2C/pyruvate dehydrogenase (lipoamide) phosphatase [Phaffia rhodozyma]|uniref:Protein phosphatase 2C/pyruvate dehydrogenase (Lipoamide) phosphatase n=1 Tax=Phaffia rhodozyma TaxID=264483 RepID=A0A0F7SMB2_PHARH|nr:Protein phosphatase 2C/pyruvate dehydrogenase (lipoamide) phosphatase [Phaffia rhodozyma]